MSQNEEASVFPMLFKLGLIFIACFHPLNYLTTG